LWQSDQMNIDDNQVSFIKKVLTANVAEEIAEISVKTTKSHSEILWRLKPIMY
jgi:hypothetical protein